MRMRIETLTAGAAALFVTMAATGCGEAVIDVDKAAKFIDTAVTQQVGAKVKSVHCPGKVKIKAKSSFTCAVTGSDGTTGDAKLTQKDDKGNLTMYAPFLHTREAEQIIQTQLRKQSKTATVSCPEIIVVAKGGTFNCEATADGVTKKIAATQTDANGNFTYRLG